MTPISLSRVEYLCLNMRDIDRREIFGLSWHDNPILLAREVVLAASYGHAAVSERNGIPTGIIGCSPIRPGVWTLFAFGTDDWRKSALELSRYGRRVLRPFLEMRSAHRAQCESHIEHSEAHRWLMSMGARNDGVLPGYGRDGSDYIMFSWSK